MTNYGVGDIRMSHVAQVVLTRTWRSLLTCSVASTFYNYFCLNEVQILQFSPDDAVPYQQPPRGKPRQITPSLPSASYLSKFNPSAFHEGGPKSLLRRANDVTKNASAPFSCVSQPVSS